MSGGSKDAALRGGGRRKDGKPFKEGNTREDGSYAVGKNRTPVRTRFAIGDGRKRGKREKGVKNGDTEFARELNRKTVVTENGVERKVTKSQAIDLRLINNAGKGDNRAIEMVDRRRQRIAEAAEHNRRYHSLSDQAILEAYLRERAGELDVDPALFGDPEPGEPHGCRAVEDSPTGSAEESKDG